MLTKVAVQRWLDSIPSSELGHCDSELNEPEPPWPESHSGSHRHGTGKLKLLSPQTLPARHIKSIMPHLLVEKLDVWSVLALLPLPPSQLEPSRTYNLVSIFLPILLLLMLIVSVIGFVGSLKGFSVRKSTLLSQSIVVLHISVFSSRSKESSSKSRQAKPLLRLS
jgi:hypothetical protein